MGMIKDTNNYLKSLVVGDRSDEEQKHVEEVAVFDSEEYRRDIGKKEIFFEKHTMSRPDRTSTNPRSSRVLTTIGLVLGVLLLIMQQFTLLLVIGSMLFISHALRKTTPDTVTYEISNYGVEYAGVLYYWPQLKSFFFSEKEGMSVLAINTVNVFPGRLFLFCDASEIAKLQGIVEENLSILEKEPESFIDKAYKSVSDKFDI